MPPRTCGRSTTRPRSAIRFLERCYDAILTSEQWREGSPLTHAAGLRVPALVVIGEQDRICPPEIGRQYAGVSGARLLEYADMAHELDAAPWPGIVREMVAWVEKH